MIPTITIPQGRELSRRWAAGVVMDRLFGQWVCKVSPSPEWVIEVGNGKGNLVPRRIRTPDSFFQTANSEWLTSNSLPRLPLQMFNSTAFGLAATITSNKLPIIFGRSTYSESGNGDVELGIDVFGSAFFMLSRYEEAVDSARDKFDRFPATASVAYRGGFLNRSIIDEYIEILWAIISKLWPELRRKPVRFRITPSHDVDEPSRDVFRGVGAVLKESIGDLVKRRNVSRAIQGTWHWLYGQWSLHPADPFNTFDQLMKLSDACGTKSTFYFMSGSTNPKYDRPYGIRHRAIRRLLRRIHEQGHFIGLHPSFETYLRPDLLSQEACRLWDVCRTLGIKQDQWGARMHYLRWNLPHTWRALEEAGLSFDASLGFADMAGFRCGTCHEYRAFDVLADRALDLVVQPLIAMDVTILNSQYMGLGTGESARKVISELRRSCEVVGGNFSLLWHNNQFQNPGEWDLYRHSLGSAAQ